MAQTSHPQSMATPVSADRVKGVLSNRHSLALRRLLAWGLEVGFLVGAAAVPWGLGEGIRQRVEADLVPLNPVSQIVQGGVARTLGQPRSSLIQEVPVTTNLLWFSGVLLPMGLLGVHLHQVAKTGKSWPKAWLGLQVVTLENGMPGYRAAFLREGGGKIGAPLGAAYLVWLGSGALLTGMTGGSTVLACALVLGATGLTNQSRRALHDYWAGTKVLLLRGGRLPVRHPVHHGEVKTATVDLAPDGTVSPLGTQTALVRPTVATAAHRLFPFAQAQLLTMTQEEGGLRAIVISPLEETQPQRWWQRLSWGSMALGVAGVTLALALGHGLRRQALVGTALSAPAGGSDDLFLALVENLSLRANTFRDQQAAALALASSQDPRAITLLVDLLAQTGDPALLDTIQQALVTLGPPALPHLQRLNLALANDIVALAPDQRLIAQLRQRTVKRTLAKILVLHSGQLQGVDLSGTNLAQVAEGPDAFTLVLEQQNLAGIRWNQAVLSGARLRKVILFDPGPDGRPDTFDDWISDLSQSDLTEASLVAAQLRHTLFHNASLLRANLSNAQAQYADFSGANASSALFIAAEADQARFRGTSLSGADFTEAQLTQADFTEARLREATLAGANLTQAILSRADLNAADLRASTLTGANLAEADLRNSRLTQAHLENANLQNANLQNANLQDTVLTGANLAGANLQGAVFFTATAPPSSGFIATLAEPETGNALAGVDFSRAKNLDPDQLGYICQQGGTHPQCGP
ncbi:hypothetical protein GFS31_05350 [Leptolyngbya sp. BL0902]|uniref:pentapeptide repeat-containing protein n=1 Tax=Leptolyngbya sp. BL0902 TaxID=1115757 RepID=UPI0018E86D93|nr:pentapeptide repeat-containing protein [Leptolyngbya sp. BL0902]QQE63864.1 hypothetical protein GFS31_05350 [Leptolyngbya sp. BL0902]